MATASFLQVADPPGSRPRPSPTPAPLPHGELCLLVAPPEVLAATEAALILATAREREVLLVNGDNRFDAYGLLAQARARGLEAEVADGLHLARAFTVHQLASLVEETLPRLAQEHPRAGLVLVTGLLELFLDEDVEAGEARRLLARVLRTLRAWTATTNLPVLATTTSAGSARGLLPLARDAVVRTLEEPPVALPLPRVALPQTRLSAFVEAG